MEEKRRSKMARAARGYRVMGHNANSPSLDSGHMERGEVPEVEWKPGKQEWAVMLTLALISLMVALDATILVSVLPVST